MIGGSIGLRARRNGLHVIGYDSDPLALEEARVAGAIDVVESFDELPRRTDVLVIAAHLGATLSEIERLRERSDAVCTLMLDVASVKTPVVAAARGLKNFVATHPMAGSERSGASNARGDLFEGRPWAYVSTGDADLDARACNFIESLGALPLAIGAGRSRSHCGDHLARSAGRRLLLHAVAAGGKRRRATLRPGCAGAITDCEHGSGDVARDPFGQRYER